MWLEIITQIFWLCIIPLLGILTKYLVDFLKSKKQEIIDKVDNDTADKYINMIFETVETCVIATNQTYVDSLKASGTFDEAAQKEAFNRTLNAILAILTDDCKEYIVELTGDLQTYLTTLIEAQVNKNKTVTAGQLSL